jgi:hypothetical protein
MCNLTQTRITEEFLVRVLRTYTRRLEDREAKKNGSKKLVITKEEVCQEIIKDMEKAGLI